MSTLKIQLPKAFEPFLQPARYKAAFGGRGSSKSHSFATMVVLDCLAIPGCRVLCVREVQKSLKESAKRLIEDKIVAYGQSEKFESLVGEIRTPGNGIINFIGMTDHTADTAKSFEGYHRAWVEEAHVFSARSWEILRPTIRTPGSEIWATWNPRNAEDPMDKFFRGDHPPEGAIIRQMNYMDNPWFTGELERERAHDELTNPERYAHIWLGAYEPQAIGAIFNRQNFHRNRIDEIPPDLKRIVVAVDPAVSSESGSDENGIVAVGLGPEKPERGYVLKDASMRGTPAQWGARALALHDELDADAIVIERNQGGDMCRHTLKTLRPGVKIVEVIATRGKHVRAEPISGLYEENRISHVGPMEKLEGQLCLAAGTLVETDQGLVPIEVLGAHHRVLTRKGFAPVRWAGYTGHASEFVQIGTERCKIRATKCHPIFDMDTGRFVNAEHVSGSERLLVSRSWESMVDQLLGADGGIIGCPRDTIGVEAQRGSCFTGQFMKRIRALSRLDWMCTTLTKIRGTTDWKTWKFLLEQSILQSTLLASLESMPFQDVALSAVQRQERSHSRQRNTVLRNVLCEHGELLDQSSHLFRSLVDGAGSLENPSASGNSVLGRARTITTLERMTCESEPVYNLSVAEGYLPEFFANGILVHNCNITAGGYEGNGSPDRADALIWGLSELFQKFRGGQRIAAPIIIPIAT